MKSMDSFPSQLESVLNRNGLSAPRFSGWWQVWSRNGNREGALLVSRHRIVSAFPPDLACSRDIPDMTCCVYDEYKEDVDLFMYFGQREPILIQAGYDLLDFIRETKKPLFSRSDIENYYILEKSPRVTYDGSHPSQTIKASGHLFILPDGLEFRSVDYLGKRRWLFLPYNEIKGVQFIMNRVTTLGMMALAKVTSDRILKPRLVVATPSRMGDMNNIHFSGPPKLKDWAVRIKQAGIFYKRHIAKYNH
jgi:hypothetical protein